jgi:hypothetical protein
LGKEEAGETTAAIRLILIPMPSEPDSIGNDWNTRFLKAWPVTGSTKEEKKMKRNIILTAVFFAFSFGVVMETMAREAQAQEFVFFRRVRDGSVVNVRTIPAGKKFILGDIVAQVDGSFSEFLTIFRNNEEILSVLPPSGETPWSHQFRNVVFKAGDRLRFQFGTTPVNQLELNITITGKEVNM